MYAPTYRIMNWDRQAPVIPISSYSPQIFFFLHFCLFSLYFDSGLVFRFAFAFSSSFRSFVRFRRIFFIVRQYISVNYTILLLCNLRLPESELYKVAKALPFLSTPLLHLPHFLCMFSSSSSSFRFLHYYNIIIYFLFVRFRKV